MGTINNEQYAAAVATLSADDMTAKGAPKAAALNAALVAMELDELAADERAAMWEAHQAIETPADELDSNRKLKVTLTEAQTDPLVLKINGQSFELVVGEETIVPAAVLDPLSDVAGITYEWKEE